MSLAEPRSLNPLRPVLDADEAHLRRVEAAALRVASSRRNGVVMDVPALDRLDAALEGTAPSPVACTVDLSAEQLRYLWRLINSDVAESNKLIRSRTFLSYGPAESATIHDNVRIGATLLGSLPLPVPVLTNKE